MKWVLIITIFPTFFQSGTTTKTPFDTLDECSRVARSVVIAGREHSISCLPASTGEEQ